MTAAPDNQVVRQWPALWALCLGFFGYTPAASSVGAMLAAPISLCAESRRTSRSNTAPTARW